MAIPDYSNVVVISCFFTRFGVEDASVVVLEHGLGSVNGRYDWAVIYQENNFSLILRCRARIT